MKKITLAGMALAVCMLAGAAAPAQAGPVSKVGVMGENLASSELVQKVGWHNRWRSHRRWGSRRWHNRWRSHRRWGSRDDWHSRRRSHRRWGSRRW